MSRRLLSVLVILVACAAPSMLSPLTTATAGPPTELMGDGGTPIPLKNKAMISKTDWGLRYRAGQQNSHLTVTIEGDQVRYVDTGTREWRSLPRLCRAVNVEQGVAATCRIPARYRGGATMVLEIWPRLGDDYVDGSQLPANVRFWTLADEGFDTVYAGAGDDFVNGAQDNDVIHGGAGHDWLRGGIGDDKIWGDDGNDKLTAIDGADEIHGGAGDDRVGGGPGDDSLYGDAGGDFIVCGTGYDAAWYDAYDRTNACESRTAQ